uniref:H15 domain-containing protein n=1 Tax=Ananas comosus var. bracteatus TaxID=296719 RepID=A0A6V7PWK7_ANACO|nr:unnamed protein product [Ananas comosus var. bracteatus]
MIRCAIEALGEGSGSTVQSISDYIKAKFHGLPPAHNRLIVFYLNQLIESGEFAVGGAPDRYVVVSNSPSPPAPSAIYSSPESMIKCAIQTLSEGGGSTQESICSYVLANFGELPWAPRKFLFFFVNRMLERGELVAGAGPGRYVLAPTSSGPKSSVGPQERPSKAEEEGPSVLRSELKSSDGGGGGGGGGDSVSKTKRGRGRTPTKRTNASESSQPDAAQEPKMRHGPHSPASDRLSRILAQMNIYSHCLLLLMLLLQELLLLLQEWK